MELSTEKSCRIFFTDQNDYFFSYTDRYNSRKDQKLHSASVLPYVYTNTLLQLSLL